MTLKVEKYPTSVTLLMVQWFIVSYIESN